MKVCDLVKVLDTMHVPLFRKELTTSNVRWLLRNLRVRNAQHPDINEVIAALKGAARASR
jgi:hypothetical protein